jgi:hypothetical protein
MDCPSRDDVTHDSFLFPLGDATQVSSYHAWVSISAHWYYIIDILRIIVLYYTTSWGGGCVCLVSVSALVISRRVESTERRALLLGSPRFCIAKAAQVPPQF